jgi:dipeptidyl-peptidase 4
VNDGGFPGRHSDDLAYPQQTARTQGFSLGVPRNLTVSPDGERVVFLRSPSGDDPVTALWVLDVGSGDERLVFDPHADADADDLTDAERARRERARERAHGVVAYACDDAVSRAVLLSGGRLLMVELASGEVGELPTAGPAYDPCLSPDGSRVAYVVEGDLHVQDLDGLGRVLVTDADPDVRWGVADFAAAEEMRRMRGFWWSPDGGTIVAARVDERPVSIRYLADPTLPERLPAPIRYPHAGTANADVTLHLIDVATGAATEVTWDRDALEYLARVTWADGAPLTLLVQSRDQRTAKVLEVDDDGVTRAIAEETDERWVELVEGAPARLRDGRLVTVVVGEGRRRVSVDGAVVTPAGLHVLDLVAADDAVWFRATDDDPTQTHVWCVVPGDEPRRVTREPGEHIAAVGGGVIALKSYLEDEQHPRVLIRRGDGNELEIVGRAEEPVIDPRPRYASLGERALRAALVLPGGEEPDDGVRLPVLLSPYGGPHHREVVRTRGAYREAQYFADRLRAAVLVIDGRGTPGRDVPWEQAVYRDFTVTLEDQIEGLQAALATWPFLDGSRVAMRGWSFGGWLSAAAVTYRPDAVHAAVAGAPVTDFTLYDTHYTERYLGTPHADPDAYRRGNVIADTASLTRPLLLIHGLADDNVLAANTLRYSAALFEAGIHHDLVLLPNASHIGGSGTLVTARYLAELDFLHRALGASSAPEHGPCSSPATPAE